jgi:transposase
MSFRIPDERIPESEPWADEEFLAWAYNERGLSPRMIAYELAVSKSHITVYLERYGMTRRHRHEPTLRHLYVEEGLSAEEIAALEEFDCSPVTVKRYLAEYGISTDDPDDVTYGRLTNLGSESPSSA